MTQLKREHLIEELGFKKVTAEVIGELSKKTTKAAQSIIERMDDSNFYEVYVSESQVTINSTYLVTSIESKQIAKILKVDYIKVGTLMDDNGMWGRWINALNS